MGRRLSCTATYLLCIFASIAHNTCKCRTFDNKRLSTTFAGSGYHDVQQSSVGQHARAGTTVNVNSDSSISYVADNEWLAYTIDASTGIYKVQYLLSGDPTAGVPLDMYLTLDTVGCGGTRHAVFATSSFDAGTWYPSKAYAASTVLYIAAGGRRRLTVCFAKASWVTFFGLKIDALSSVAVVLYPSGTVKATSFISAADKLFGTYIEGECLPQ
jgi:hypothetical protein